MLSWPVGKKGPTTRTFILTQAGCPLEWARDLRLVNEVLYAAEDINKNKIWVLRTTSLLAAGVHCNCRQGSQEYGYGCEYIVRTVDKQNLLSYLQSIVCKSEMCIRLSDGH